MAIGLAALMLAGAALAFVTPLVPRSEEIEETAYIAIGAVALAAGVLLLTASSRLPYLVFQLLTALGTALITATIYYAGSERAGASENELLYLWPVLYAAYFFGRRAMLGQLAAMGVLYAGLLVMLDTGEPGIGRWVGTMLPLLAAAGFVRYLRERHDRDLSLHLATIESTNDGILVVDDRGRWVSFNRRFLEMWRMPAEIAASRDDDAALEFVLAQIEAPAAFLAKVRELYSRPDAESVDEVRFKDGRVFERCSLPQRIDGESVGRVWSFRDVTEQKHSQERLRHLADHDPLTDLLNRRRFDEELDRETKRARRYGPDGALVLLDLDDLKHVNDSQGHLWGDEVLRSAARLLRSRLRSTDVLARIGGDEFAVLLPQADRVRAVKLGEELLEVFRRHSFDTEDGPIGVTTSIGLVDFASLSGTDTEPMVAADTAMYRAKREGRDRLALYDPAVDTKASGAAARSRPGERAQESRSAR